MDSQAKVSPAPVDAKQSNNQPDSKSDEQQTANLDQILTFLTTEHFTLQTASAATITESSGRANLYIGTVSGALVAQAFIAQISRMGPEFFIFSLVLLPVLFFIGLVTFIRTLETAMQNNYYLRAMGRIRRYYVQIAPQVRNYIMLPVSDDQIGAAQSSSPLAANGSFATLLTTAGMVSVINSVMAGVFVGLFANSPLALPMLVDVATGIVVFVASLVLHTRYQTSAWQRTMSQVPVLFPSEQTQQSKHSAPPRLTSSGQ